MTVKDLATILAEDHLALQRVCTELDLSQGSPENRKEMADHLIAEFVQHLVAEEPFRPEGVPDDVEDVMRRLAEAGPQESRFEPLLSALLRTVRHHVHRTGPAIVQRVRSSCSPEQRRDLGEEVLTARAHARSLPHPAVSDRKPANALLRPGPGFVDRARSAMN